MLRVLLANYLIRSLLQVRCAQVADPTKILLTEAPSTPLGPPGKREAPTKPMAERTEPRVQRNTSAEDYDTWPPPAFRDKLLADLGQFIHTGKTDALRTASFNCPLSLEAHQSFNNKVCQYITEYLQHHIRTRDKPMHFHPSQNDYPMPMQRFINQIDDPFSAHGVTQKANQIPHLPVTVANFSGHEGSRDSIQRAGREAGEFGWPEVEFGHVRVVATTRGESHNKNLEKTVESCSRVISVGGGTSFHHIERRDASRARSSTGVEGTEFREGSSSNFRENYTHPKHEGKRLRPNESFTNGQNLSPDQAAPSRRQSVTSKASRGSSRRDPKQHICIVCKETFPFDARLRSHMAVHRTDKLRCDGCGSGFGRESSLKRHQTTPGACQKKKEAKLRHSSFQGTLGLRPESQNGFDGDAATSMTSSYHKSDGVSVDDNPPSDTRYNVRLQAGCNFMQTSNAPASPRPGHGTNYNHRSERAPGHQYSQTSHTVNQNFPRNHHRALSPQVQPSYPGWGGIDPALWGENGVYNPPEFEQYIHGLENE